MMNWRYLILLAAFTAHAQTPAVKRPPIVGVAHIALKTKDLAKSREFYGRYLGYQEINSPPSPRVAYFKVNDHQYIEVSNELKSETEDRVSHIAFETTNARQLRDYLAS